MKDIDKKAIETINSIQGELLRETVKYAFTNSAYYRDAFKKSGITPKDIKGISDIEILPVTTREDIQKDSRAFLCVPNEKIAEIVSTSGTTGASVFFAMTENDIERLTENEKRCFSLAGVTRNDLFLIAVTLDNLFIAGMAYYRGLLKLGAGVIRIGPRSPKRHIEIIQALKPTGIVAIPSFMLALHKEAEKEGIRPGELSLKKAVLIGESIRNMDFSSNSLGGMLNDKNVDIECYSTYGITEAAVAFCECPFHQGFHSHPDLVFAEILDSEGNQVKEGKVGELVLTTFRIEAMPLIRYRTGDMTFARTEKCDCGRTSLRIGPIVGRKAHKLKLKGTTVYPKTIENALININGLENYIIEVYTGEDHADQVIVKVGSRIGTNSFQKTICDNIRAKARVTPHVKVVKPEVVEKLLYEGGRRKPRIFIDRRHKAL